MGSTMRYENPHTNVVAEFLIYNIQGIDNVKSCSYSSTQLRWQNVRRASSCGVNRAIRTWKRLNATSSFFFISTILSGSSTNDHARAKVEPSCALLMFR
jgi:hypothetical protein